nr:LysR substrate-binding domain-containing protein [Salinicola tamaricis]
MVRFFSGSNAADDTLDLRIDGQIQGFAGGGWLTVNDAGSYVEAARQGCGLVQLPRFHIEEQLAQGVLEEVLEEWDKPRLTLWAVYPQRRQLAARVRVFVDWVSELYAARFPA